MIKPFFVSKKPALEITWFQIGQIVLQAFRALPAGLSTAALLLGACAPSIAQTLADREFDEANKPWQEIELTLPAAPLVENLLPFFVTAISSQAFSIDVKSLSVGTDGVVRYTLVTKSQSGAENVSYEGIRCSVLTSKSFAFGRKDGSWSISNRGEWISIRTGGKRHQIALAADYLCENGYVAGDLSAILDRLQKSKTLAEQFQK